MKPGTLTSRRIWLPVLALGLIVALVSWDRKQSPTGTYQQEANPTDTTPKKKKSILTKRPVTLMKCWLKWRMWIWTGK